MNYYRLYAYLHGMAKTAIAVIIKVAPIKTVLCLVKRGVCS